MKRNALTTAVVAGIAGLAGFAGLADAVTLASFDATAVYPATVMEAPAAAVLSGDPPSHASTSIDERAPIAAGPVRIRYLEGRADVLAFELPFDPLRALRFRSG